MTDEINSTQNTEETVLDPKSESEPGNEVIESINDQVPAQVEDIEEGVPLTQEELRQQLIEELDNLIERVRELEPGYAPPPFSFRAMMDLLEGNIRRYSPTISRGILQKLRSGIGEDLLDIDTWKGMWYMINYTLEYQSDIFRRRFSGDYETDEWGYDPEFLQVVEPFMTFLYKTYFRVETSGMDNVPEEGRALFVCNHSGQIPWDGAMLGTAIYLEHPNQRLLRTLYAAVFPTVPFISGILVKLGQVLADEENGMRLLENGELVSVFPEGYKGIGKLFRERYRLARFGRGGFVRMALKTGSPMIPVSIVGAEETYISLHKSSLLASLFGVPYFPITPTFPWLGPLGFIPLPTKWYIDIGEPIPTEQYGKDASADEMLVSRLSDQVRNVIQDMISTRLAKRRSIFLG